MTTSNGAAAMLAYVESERIISVLEDTTEKLAFLDSITPDVLQHRDELSKFIGDEISRTMAEQKSLEKRYEELIETRAAMKGMHNKNKYKEVQEEIQDISRALRESTNNLVRSLKENPNVSGNLIKVQRDRTELHDLLLRCNQELRDRGTYHTITRKVDEENGARVRFQQLKSREKGLRDAVAKLQESLTEEQRVFQKTTVEQRQAIAQLKDELQSIKGSASNDSKFKRKESLATISAIWREFKLKERHLEEKLAELEDRMQTELVVNTETKDFLVRKHSFLQEEIARWDAKYETEVGDIDNEIRLITTHRSSLLDNLSMLQARKQLELDEERSKREATDLEVEMIRQKKALTKKQNAAARTIQRELRALVKRKKEMEAIKGDGKKGKKEKGGKKGKK